MTSFEYFLSGSSLTAAVAVVVYVRHVVLNSGRNRPNEQTLIRKLIDSVPINK